MGTRKPGQPCHQAIRPSGHQAIRPSPNGQSFELLVGRARLGPRFARETEGSVDFGDGPIKAILLNYGVADKKSRQTASFHQFRIAGGDMARSTAQRPPFPPKKDISPSD